jgi:hypothetical protein
MGVGALATRTPEGFFQGFPMEYGHQLSSCSIPNPLNGCGFSYDVGVVVLDYLFLSLIFFTFLFAAQAVRTRVSRLLATPSPRP